MVVLTWQKAGGMQDALNVVMGWIAWIWGQWQVQVLVCHVMVNVVVAVAVSIATGEFVLAKTGEFLYKKVLPLVLIYAAFSAAGETLGMTWVATTTWLLLETELVGDLFDNLKKFGIQNGRKLPLLAAIPSGLTKEREE
jgi:hypothetical protein